MVDSNQSIARGCACHSGQKTERVKPQGLVRTLLFSVTVQDAGGEEDAEDGSLAEMLAGIPGKNKKRKKNNGKAKAPATDRAIVPYRKKEGEPQEL